MRQHFLKESFVIEFCGLNLIFLQDLRFLKTPAVHPSLHRGGDGGSFVIFVEQRGTVAKRRPAQEVSFERQESHHAVTPDIY